MTTPAAPMPCPFCGATLRWSDAIGWVHPERVVDTCVANAVGLRTERQIAAWNRRAPVRESAPGGAMREGLEWAAALIDARLRQITLARDEAWRMGRVLVAAPADRAAVELEALAKGIRAHAASAPAPAAASEEG